MKYNFDTVNDRTKTNSMKWNVPKGELPMWVADMDFITAPAVCEAVSNRAKSGIFGYTEVSLGWYDSIINWWGERHSLKIERDELTFCTGVIPAITCIVKRITNIGDKVLVQTPCYDIFFNSIENSGRKVLENPLLYDGEKYEIDFVNLEKGLSDRLTTMMILCNPHNPCGRIWTKEELLKISELCKKYGVTVLSDEIHCDITELGFKYVPFASVCESSISCISASKAFNLAGLQSAAVIVKDENLRNKVVRGLNSDEVAEPNCFASEASEAAFKSGGEWLDEMREYIFKNRRRAEKFIMTYLPQIHAVKAEATYLLWLDCSEITDNASELGDFIRKKTGLYLSSGNRYRGNGKYFLRMNAACPSSVLEDGLNRLRKGIEIYGSRNRQDP